MCMCCDLAARAQEAGLGFIEVTDLMGRALFVRLGGDGDHCQRAASETHRYEMNHQGDWPVRSWR